ncbi:MAG: hypothetical protein V1879_03415, partial [Pseudomonadota bacterium]
ANAGAENAAATASAMSFFCILIAPIQVGFTGSQRRRRVQANSLKREFGADSVAEKSKTCRVTKNSRNCVFSATATRCCHGIAIELR